jgi:hypothetical protein
VASDEMLFTTDASPAKKKKAILNKIMKGPKKFEIKPLGDPNFLVKEKERIRGKRRAGNKRNPVKNLKPFEPIHIKSNQNHGSKVTYLSDDFDVDVLEDYGERRPKVQYRLKQEPIFKSRTADEIIFEEYGERPKIRNYKLKRVLDTDLTWVEDINCFKQVKYSIIKDHCYAELDDDNRTDHLSGTELIHKNPLYANYKIVQNSTFKIFGFKLFDYGFIKHDYLVSEELAAQILLLSNVNRLNDDGVTYRRLLMSAQSVCKVNEDKYLPLEGKFPRQDTIDYCYYLSKFMKSNRTDLDFRLSPPGDITCTVIAPQKSNYLKFLSLKTVSSSIVISVTIGLLGLWYVRR